MRADWSNLVRIQATTDPRIYRPISGHSLADICSTDNLLFGRVFGSPQAVEIESVACGCHRRGEGKTMRRDVISSAVNMMRDRYAGTRRRHGYCGREGA